MAQRGAALPRLRALRLRAGMTQKDLADATGVSLTTINRLERLPDAPAEMRTARVLAAALGCAVSDLMEQP